MSTGKLAWPDGLAKYQGELAHLKSALDVAFGPNVRNNPNTPEDRVVFPLGVATRDLCEEVISFVYQGFGNAALRTARTLYECVVFSLYINKHPETWKSYLNKMYAQWAKVLQNIPGTDSSLPKIHSDISEKVPEFSKGKYIPQDWNDDRTTYNMAKDVGISDPFHSLAFNYSSGFVHPSAMFLLNSFSRTAPDGPLLVGVKVQDMESKMAVQITHDMIINAIRLRLKYSDSLALRDALSQCEKDFFSVWSYHPQLTPQNT
jgi:Family of unknown function (DUF5677)